MYYIFSSAIRDLYKRGVLETCAYPDNHVHRYRYSERLVPRNIQNTPERLLGQDCLIVYAYEQQDTEEFEFLPLRRGVIVECNVESGFLFIDVKLAAFVGTDHLQSWRRTIGSHANRPHPKPTATGEGYFVYEAAELDGLFSDHTREASWKAVIDELSSTPLKDCITYQVLGFYNVTGLRQRVARWARAALANVLSRPIFRPNVWASRQVQGALQFLLSRSEKRIEPSVRGSDCWYRLPMGDTILLRLIIYRRTDLASGSRKALVLDYDQKAFSSVSDSTVAIESRYDDVRTLLSCARLVDPTLTSFSIRQRPEDGENRIWAAEPTFLLRVGPPRFFLVFTLALFALGLYCLNLGASDVLPISEPWLKCHTWLALLAKHPRPLGTVLVLYASWNYLRKFPLK